MVKYKQPSKEKEPGEKKKPRGGEKAGQTEREILVWHVGMMDREGPWGWNKVDAPTFWERIHGAMTGFETMTWGQISGRRHHLIPAGNLSSAAQWRLKEIGQDDIDDLFSLALSGKERLWGIRDRNIFKLLWFDPEHSVYPVEKRHS